MTRIALLAVVAVGACVAINPDWDDPAASTTGTTIVPRGTDTGAEGGVGEGVSTTFATTSTTGSTTDAGGGSTSSDGSSSDGSSSTGEAPCHDNWARCDGMCTEVEKDPVHCGDACIDCRIEFGSDAECSHGMCREHGGEGKRG